MIEACKYRSAVRRAAFFLGCATVTALVGCGGSNDEVADPSRVTTQSGVVHGAVVGEQRSFLGIPYAAPPLGKLRWAAPQSVASWEAPRDALAFGSPCAQLVTDSTGRPVVAGNEDCLYLNVYAPVGYDTALPVLVFVHGGAFRNGAGSDYDAGEFSRKGQAVVVTLNYRLGVFGFLALSALAAETSDRASGQYGLLDQRQALDWVRRNIAGFGGDPGNVTLVGESSGANSVCNQLASPKVSGLFHKVVLQSGACSSPSTSLAQAPAEAAGSAFAQAAGCVSGDVPACLRALDATTLVKAPATERIGAGFGWAPALGGTTFPSSSAAVLKSGTFAKVPALIGANREDYRVFVALQEFGQGSTISDAQYLGLVNGTFGAGAPPVLAAYPLASYPAANQAQSALLTDFAFACPTQTTANIFSTVVDTYVYEFDDPTAPTQVPGPFIQQRSYHGAELLYLFRQPLSLFGFGPVAALSPAQQTLADQMIVYWSAFAATGSPNRAGSPVWPRYSQSIPAVQRLAQGQVGAISTFGADHRCAFWVSFGV